LMTAETVARAELHYSFQTSISPYNYQVTLNLTINNDYLEYSVSCSCKKLSPTHIYLELIAIKFMLMTAETVARAELHYSFQTPISPNNYQVTWNLTVEMGYFEFSISCSCKKISKSNNNKNPIQLE